MISDHAGVVLGVLGFAIFPAIAVVAGGLVAFVYLPRKAVRSGIQHFAAGLIFCVLATELLPDLAHRRMPLWTIVGFSLGFITMVAIKFFSENAKMEGKSSPKLSMGLLAAMGIDIALDGLLIGLGFAAGKKQGLLLTIAMTLEVFFLGLACATSLSANSEPRGRMIWIPVLLGALLLAGAAEGAIALTVLPSAALDALLAFGVAALLYLVTEELLVEAHEAPGAGEQPPVMLIGFMQTGMFFIGFIVLLIVGMIL
ncbi:MULTISPECIES: ZIP family metal transporter [Janthinobacterium]|uniref:ZIP family metal transporter n=1 Tax=Janthinobacterium TaxID=29580 RepID=UPI000CC57C03|nr:MULTISPECIES: transporter [Janthinobacterium]PKV44051.1 ZIP family zinc transporter [Janthinobacterium sp. 61]